MNKISEFQGPYRWLSNFWCCKIIWNGKEAYSAEAHYQAAKSLDPYERAQIRMLPAGMAKRAGRKIKKLRPDWNEVKDEIMLDIVRAKFQDPHLAQRLVETWPMVLEEGNHWGDKYWGICNGEGENRLGKILMQVRDELR